MGIWSGAGGKKSSRGDLGYVAAIIGRRSFTYSFTRRSLIAATIQPKAKTAKRHNRRLGMTKGLSLYQAKGRIGLIFSVIWGADGANAAAQLGPAFEALPLPCPRRMADFGR